MGMLREAFGFALLAIGAIGVVVPLIPGIPFLLAGGLILAPKYPFIRACFRRVRRWRMKPKKTLTGRRDEVPRRSA